MANELHTATLFSSIHTGLTLRKNASEIYIAIGRTNAWVNDKNPPNADETKTELDTLIGYKKANTVSLAKKLASDEETTFQVVNYGTERYALIPDGQAYEQKANFIYFKTSISDTDFPLGRFRQVGIQVDVKRRSGINKENLLPSEVSNKGILYYYENREDSNRFQNVATELELLVRL